MSTTPPVQYPPIPYGRGNFRSVRLDGCLYVDKTRFIRTLEQKRFVFFIRPRRFGKTLWLTMLDAYYDRTVADEFEAVFAGTDIGREPTGNRSRYVVLYFDFSAFKQALPTLEESFEEYCTAHLRHALRRNRDLFDEVDLPRSRGRLMVFSAPGNETDAICPRPPETGPRRSWNRKT